MEHHFILRFSKDFKDTINIYESKIERIDDDRIKLFYKNKTYPGICVKLPCVVESQKTLDNKQFYKVCDVSTLVVVYPNENVDFQEEKRCLQLSGLTPPMKYVKSRRFKKKNVKYHELEEIESKVLALLERDRRATKVEILSEENSDEITDIATEIENTIEVEPVGEETPVEVEDSPEVKELKKQIEEQEKRVQEALNPILKQRFRNVLNDLKKKLNEVEGKGR